MFWYTLLINVGFTALRTPFSPRALFLHMLLLISGRRYFCIYSICWWLLLMCILGKILIPDIWWGSPSPSCPDRSRFRPWCNHCAAKFWRSFGGTTWYGIDLSLHCCCSNLWCLHFCCICQLFCLVFAVCRWKHSRTLALMSQKEVWQLTQLSHKQSSTSCDRGCLPLPVLYSCAASSCVCLRGKQKRAFAIPAHMHLHSLLMPKRIASAHLCYLCSAFMW